MKPLIHRTIRGDYDPRDVQRYESVSKNEIPSVATYSEPIMIITITTLGMFFVLFSNTFPA